MKRRWRRERSREWGEFGDAERLHGRRCNSHMNPQITHKLTNGSEGSADLKRAKLCTHVDKTLQCTPGGVRQGRAPQPYLGYRHSLLPSRIPACTFRLTRPGCTMIQHYSKSVTVVRGQQWDNQKILVLEIFWAATLLMPHETESNN